jgi:hypothetical protein
MGLGASTACRTTLGVISWNSTRIGSLGSRPKSLATCQPMASPSRSGSVAMRSLLPWAARFSSSTTGFLSFFTS